MGTEVLLPQDLLAARFQVPPALHWRPSPDTAHRRISPRRGKKRSNFRPDRGGTKKASHGGATAARRKDDGPVIGQVVLLQRGEPLDSLASKKTDGPIKKPADDTAVLGIEPEMVTKDIRPSTLDCLGSRNDGRESNRNRKPADNRIESEIVRKETTADVYAGWGFDVSPSPRYLPVPVFLNKPDLLHID